MCVVPTGWATLGNIPLGNTPLGSIPLGNIPLGNVTLGIVTLGPVTFGEVVVDHTLEAATIAATGTLWTDEPSGTLDTVVEIIDVDKDKGGGHFGNGLLRTECEGFFFHGDEYVASVGTFCVIFLIFVGATTLVIFILFAVVFISTANRLPLLVPFCIGSVCSLNFGGRTISPSL
jgi:hypothetical protein